MSDDVPEATLQRTTTVTDSWAEVPARAAALVDDPRLIALTGAIVEDGPPPQIAAPVHAALVDALAQSSNPAVVGECLTLLLESSSALEHIGEQLYDLCLDRARPPAVDADPRAWLLAADALEAATRLALGNWAPHFALLAQLIRLPALTPPLFARIALRCLAASYERWREQALVAALERIAGIAPAAAVPIDAATAEQWTHDVAPDAAYELGCASLLQALTAATVHEAEEHLQTAERRLGRAAADREDAAVLADAVGLLAAHLPTDAGRAARAATDLMALAERLERRVKEHVVGYANLGHWRTYRLDAEVAWAQLARDVARTSAALEEVSWYHAEEVLADVLAAYTASRCSRVLRREDHRGVRAMLGPSIESGLAVQAGLMKHLDDHIRALQTTEQLGRPEHGRKAPDALDSSAELDAARSLLAAARAKITAQSRPPKLAGSAASAPTDWPAALPLLHQMLGGDLAALGSLPPALAVQLENSLADRQEAAGGGLAGRDALVVSDTFARLQQQLVGSSYYTNEVKEVVDELMLLLLRFWRSRDGLGPSRMPYLFDPAAIEEDLARDLKVFLDGSPMAALMATEVRDVGGGRVDVACIFPRFRLYIELKKDDRMIDVAEKQRYLAQTAGYQGADVPIGFMAVLDLRRRTGPTPHLISCFDVVVLDEPELGQPRYIVTVLVPGNRTKPSAMRR